MPGIDEITLTTSRRNSVAGITAQTATGRVLVLTVCPDRWKATGAARLQSIPETRRQQIQTVWTDMWVRLCHCGAGNPA